VYQEERFVVSTDGDGHEVAMLAMLDFCAAMDAIAEAPVPPKCLKWCRGPNAWLARLLTDMIDNYPSARVIRKRAELEGKPLSAEEEMLLTRTERGVAARKKAVSKSRPRR
jgi:hypothetical protein